MRIARAPHAWAVPPARALDIQRRLAARVRVRPLRREPRRVAGVDAALTPDGRGSVAVVVVWDLAERCVIEQRSARRRLRFPYVPGLLSFREAPVVLAALRKLSGRPDVLVCDAHGLAHPRRFGLACHVGLLAALPTLGCAKSRLCGRHDEPGQRRGARVDLVDRGEVVGSALCTRDGVKPVYVSVGHRIDLRGAERVVLGCGAGYRLPEPTRLADRIVGELSRTPD